MTVIASYARRWCFTTTLPEQQQQQYPIVFIPQEANQDQISMTNQEQQQHDYWTDLASIMLDRVIGNQYQLLEELGRGSYGALYLGQSVDNGEYVAVKVLAKNGLDHQQLQLQQLEADIQSELKHPHILALQRVIQEEQYTYMVMELCDQGDLFDFVVRQQGPLDESLVKSMFLQILDAVEYMHSKNVYHRDIKLENILLKSDALTCKVADFGLATRERLSMEYGCGSSTYLAPEHFADGDDKENEDDVPYDAALSDVWSLGILLLALLYGRNPWQEATSMDPAFLAFKRNPAMLKDQLFPTLSMPCLHLLQSTLSIHPQDRISVSELKQQFINIKHLTTTSMDSTADDDQLCSAVNIPAVCPKSSNHASFDSAIFSAATMPTGSWSDIVEEDELWAEQHNHDDDDDDASMASSSSAHGYDDDEDDTDMFVHQDEKESWWM